METLSKISYGGFGVTAWGLIGAAICFVCIVVGDILTKHRNNGATGYLYFFLGPIALAIQAAISATVAAICFFL